MIRSVMHLLDNVSVLPTPLVAPVISVITHSGHGMRLMDVRYRNYSYLTPLSHTYGGWVLRNMGAGTADPKPK